MSKRDKQPEISERAERIEKAINYLTQKIGPCVADDSVGESNQFVNKYNTTRRMSKKTYRTLSRFF